MPPVFIYNTVEMLTKLPDGREFWDADVGASTIESYSEAQRELQRLADYYPERSLRIITHVCYLGDHITR